MSKREMRKELAALSFSEKAEILEKLRDRSLAFAAAGLRVDHPVPRPTGTHEFCSCPDWEPCGCGNQPPYHCMWCCHELTEEQVTAAKKRGFYSQEKG
jgi:hypothetical protein